MTLPRQSVPPTEAEKLAARFHEAYERLAPSFSYETREASALPWKDVPENNRQLMIAVCAEILAASPLPEEPPAKCPNPNCENGVIRGTPGVGCAVCNGGQDVPLRDKRPIRVKVDQDAFFEAGKGEDDSMCTTGNPNFERDATVAASSTPPSPADGTTYIRGNTTMSKWSMKVQSRGFRLGGCGFSKGGHNSPNGVRGESWYLFLPLLLFSVTREGNPAPTGGK